MWAAIVGTSTAARRRAARDVVARLRARGVEVAGALQQESESEPGWDAVDLHSGARLPVARRSATPQLCEWEFIDASFEATRASVEAASAPIVVLEYGIIEARGRGNWAAGQAVVESPRLLLACIRPKALARIAVDMPDPVAALELDDDDDVEGFVDALLEAIGLTARGGPVARP